MNVLLSIKHGYARLIVSGKKTIEYRKRIWDSKPDYVYVYAGRPIKEIIGRFCPGEMITGDKFKVWEQTKQSGGISDLDYFDYFAGVNQAYAIPINSFELFPWWVDPYVTLPGYRAVQSFRYLPEEWKQMIDDLSHVQAAGSPS